MGMAAQTGSHIANAGASRTRLPGWSATKLLTLCVRGERTCWMVSSACGGCHASCWTQHLAQCLAHGGDPAKTCYPAGWATDVQTLGLTWSAQSTSRSFLWGALESHLSCSQRNPFLCSMNCLIWRTCCNFRATIQRGAS